MKIDKFIQNTVKFLKSPLEKISGILNRVLRSAKKALNLLANLFASTKTKLEADHYTRAFPKHITKTVALTSNIFLERNSSTEDSRKKLALSHFKAIKSHQFSLIIVLKMLSQANEEAKKSLAKHEEELDRLIMQANPGVEVKMSRQIHATQTLLAQKKEKLAFDKYCLQGLTQLEKAYAHTMAKLNQQELDTLEDYRGSYETDFVAARREASQVLTAHCTAWEELARSTFKNHVSFERWTASSKKNSYKPFNTAALLAVDQVLDSIIDAL